MESHQCAGFSSNPAGDEFFPSTWNSANQLVEFCGGIKTWGRLAHHGVPLATPALIKSWKEHNFWKNVEQSGSQKYEWNCVIK